MKSVYIILIVLFSAITSYSQSPRLVNSRDFAVELTAQYVQSPQVGILLQWRGLQLANQYAVFRKNFNDRSFPNQYIALLDSGTTEYLDNNIVANHAYEYNVRAIQVGSYRTTVRIDNQNVDTTLQIAIQGSGYASVSTYNRPFESNHKSVLLLIDETMTDVLSQEIKTLKMDLLTEGWGVQVRYAPRSEQFDGAAVKATKAIIVEERNKSKGQLSTVFIIGRIPVPYSGNIAPDAHPDHVGAWPADIYYGTLNEAIWTDTQVNTSSASRPINRNIPGDGKFDVSVMAAQGPNGLTLFYADLAIGRIDFYDMPAFEKSEIELLKAYLKRNHDYRNGRIEFVREGIIDDNFAADRFLEAFASSGWRNFSALLGGHSNTKSADFFTHLATNPSLFAYGCGGGSYTSAGGIGNTADFASKEVRGIFTMLFGSYFGDWDSRNNFMRAALASNPNVLTCSWAGRPHWFYHDLAMGLPMAHSILKSQNNYTDFLPGLIFSNNQWSLTHNGIKQIHTAFMGDPTLTLSNYDYESSIAGASIEVTSGRSTRINVTHINSPIQKSYDVFRSYSQFGVFERINDLPVTEYFDDITLFDGNIDFNQDSTIYYMIREIEDANENTNNYNLYHRGRLLQINAGNITSVEQNENFSIDLKVLGNVNNTLHLSISNNSGSQLVFNIYDVNGMVVDYLNGSATANSNTKLQLDISNLANGFYLISYSNGIESKTCKFLKN